VTRDNPGLSALLLIVRQTAVRSSDSDSAVGDLTSRPASPESLSYLFGSDTQARRAQCAAECSAGFVMVERHGFARLVTNLSAVTLVSGTSPFSRRDSETGD